MVSGCSWRTRSDTGTPSRCAFAQRWHSLGNTHSESGYSGLALKGGRGLGLNQISAWQYVGVPCVSTEPYEDLKFDGDAWCFKSWKTYWSDHHYSMAGFVHRWCRNRSFRKRNSARGSRHWCARPGPLWRHLSSAGTELKRGFRSMV